MKKYLPALLAVILILGLAQPGDAGRREKTLRNELAYLAMLPDVQWVEFEKNQVYIGWKNKPPDFAEINHQAAIKGNKAIGFKVVVWSVRADQQGWRPGDSRPTCFTSAIRWEVDSTNCRN